MTRVLRTAEVAKRLGIGRTTLWRWEQDKRIPPRRQIGPGVIGWVESELEEWIQGRPTVEAGADR